MAVFFAGTVIKEYRTNRGFSVKQLCDGICADRTLTRYESGDCVPSVFILKVLMERLGLEARKYHISVSNLTEIEFFNKCHEADILIMEGDFDGAEAALKTVKGIERELGKSEGAHIRRQMILTLQCAISRGRNDDTEKIYSMIYEALSITIPKFDEGKIPSYMLSYDEISLLNMLANTYGNSVNPDKKIKILYDVKKSIDKYYYNIYEKSRGYSQTLYNLTIVLGFSKRYDEALEVCELAIQSCIKNKRLYLLPHINFNKACALFYTGDRDSSEKLIIRAIHALENNGDYKDAEIRKKFAEKEMGIQFNF